MITPKMVERLREKRSQLLAFIEDIDLQIGKYGCIHWMHPNLRMQYKVYQFKIEEIDKFLKLYGDGVFEV